MPSPNNALIWMRASMGMARRWLREKLQGAPAALGEVMPPHDAAERFSCPVILRGMAPADRTLAKTLLGSKRLEWIRGRAEQVHEGRFDLLGSGPIPWNEGGSALAWRIDPISGARWSPDGRRLDSVRGADIKRPWELARMHFAPTLAQAEWLDPDPRHRARFIELVTDFSKENPHPRGIHWSCAMEVSIRALNVLLAIEIFQWTAPLPADFLESVAAWLWQHGSYIDRHPERIGDGLNNNHLLADLAGQVVLAIRFAGLAPASAWLARGLAAIERELPLQLTAEGFSYESSTHYHLLCSALLLFVRMVARRNAQALPPGIERRIDDMVAVTMALEGPDGRLPVFGDADSGHLFELGPRADHSPADALGPFLVKSGSPDRVWLIGGQSEAQSLRRPLPVASKLLRESRIAILGSNDLWLCVSATGPGTGGLGLHGHNDDLACEIAWAEERYVIDPGTFSYTGNPAERKRLRSASAHSAPTLDDQETHGFVPGRGFLLWRRGTTRVDGWQDDGNRSVVEFSHDAYHRLAGAPRVSRSVCFDRRARAWLVRDRCVDTRRRTRAPALRLTTALIIGRQRVSLERGSVDLESIQHPGRGLRVQSLCTGVEVRIDEFARSPGYGLLEAGTRVRISLPPGESTHIWLATACHSLAEPADTKWAFEAARALGWLEEVATEDGTSKAGS